MCCLDRLLLYCTTVLGHTVLLLSLGMSDMTTTSSATVSIRIDIYVRLSIYMLRGNEWVGLGEWPRESSGVWMRFYGASSGD
jgi:hypothetical protein